MSFFKKMLASVGIGSAKADTQLDTEQIAAGEEVSGVVIITGGQLEQHIDSLYLYIKTLYQKEENDRKVTREAVIQRVPVSRALTILADEVKEIPFVFTLPANMPVTLRKAPVWVETGLDIPMAIDPKDRDYIEVLPHRYAATVLEALDRLGFRLREVTNDYAPHFGGELPFVQEFEFVPASGPFRGMLDELEVLFFIEGRELELFLQVDRRARGLRGLFSEALNLDESFVRFSLPENELAQGADSVAGKLEALIRKFV